MSARVQVLSAGIIRQPELPGTQPVTVGKEAGGSNREGTAGADPVGNRQAPAILIRYCCTSCALEGSFARARNADLDELLECVINLHDLERRCLNRDVSLFPQFDGDLWVKIVPDVLAANGIPPSMSCEDC